MDSARGFEIQTNKGRIRMTQDEIVLATKCTDLQTQLANLLSAHQGLIVKIKELEAKNKRRLENYHQFKYRAQVFKELYEAERNRNGCMCSD